MLVILNLRWVTLKRYVYVLPTGNHAVHPRSQGRRGKKGTQKIHMTLIVMLNLQKMKQNVSITKIPSLSYSKQFSQSNILYIHTLRVLESCGARFLAPRPRNAPSPFAPTRTGPKSSKFYGPDPGPTRLYFNRTGPDQNNIVSTQN